MNPDYPTLTTGAAAPPCPSPSDELAPPKPAGARPPSSARRIASSRANGAKSRGPVTPEGKARSSRNSLIHGLAGSVLLPEADSPTFQKFRDQLLAALKPVNPIAERIAETMIAARWRQNRIWDFETALLSDVAGQQNSTIPADLRMARAFRTLSDEQTLFLLDRYETRYDRQFFRWLRLYREMNRPDPDFLSPQSFTPENPILPNLIP